MTEFKCHRTARTQGFTLIEVLVAFIILSLTLAVLLPILAGTPLQRHRVEAAEVAIRQAQSKLDSVGFEIPLRDGTVDGKFENGSSWRVEITSYNDGGAADRSIVPKLVSVTVRWPKPTDGNVFTLKTVRLVHHG